MSQPEADLPLTGVLVVSIEQAVAAPFASRQLADLGARVIKVERPGGGDFARGYDAAARGLSSYFVWLNRGKESVIADLKSPHDREFVEKLVARADVFVQNLAPGAAERLGLSARQVSERYPRAIACDVSGYGEDGPYRDRKAYDLLIQCEAGLVSITGSPEIPAKAGISVADIAAGMYAYAGILAALFERERTGTGAVLGVSLFDALAEWMSAQAYFGYFGGSDPQRSGAKHATIAPYGPFRTAGGETITIGVQSPRDWSVLCTEVLRSPGLLTDDRFVSNVQRVAAREELESIISSILRQRDLDSLMSDLVSAKMAFGVMRGAGEVMEHPQLTERSRLRTVGSSAGEMAAILPPVIWPGRELAMGPIPDLGEHDESVRAWIGSISDDS